MLKTIIGKLGEKKDNDVDVDVAQLEPSNNKCYASAFRTIQIQMKSSMSRLNFSPNDHQAHVYFVGVAAI